jgi:hypothetical protein
VKCRLQATRASKLREEKGEWLSSAESLNSDSLRHSKCPSPALVLNSPSHWTYACVRCDRPVHCRCAEADLTTCCLFAMPIITCPSHPYPSHLYMQLLT